MLNKSLIREYFAQLAVSIMFLCVLIVGYQEWRLFPDYWQIRIGISSSYFYLLAAFGLLMIRILDFKKISLVSHKVHDVTLLVTISHLLLGLLVNFLEFIYEFNYGFTAYRIFGEEILYFSIILTSLFVISLPWSYLRRRGQILSFLLPIPLYCLMLYLYRFENKLFLTLIAEDSIVEYSTALFFIISSFGFFWLQQHIEPKIIKFGLLLAAIGLFVIGGEEVSWGQRILGISTPAVIAEQNLQHEITLHNLKSIYYHVVPAYVAIGILAGAVLPAFKLLADKLFKAKAKIVSRWLPGFVTSIYFLQLSIQRYLTPEYGYSADRFADWDTVIVNEFAEAMAALGVLVFVAGLIWQERDKIKLNLKYNPLINAKKPKN